MIETLGLISMLVVATMTWRAVRGGVDPFAAILEAWFNVAIGFSINYAANFALLPMVGAHLTASSNFWLGWIYTAVSVLRQYLVRLHLGDTIHVVAVGLSRRFSR
jgi:hypothetical protein